MWLQNGNRLLKLLTEEKSECSFIQDPLRLMYFITSTCTAQCVFLKVCNQKNNVSFYDVMVEANILYLVVCKLVLSFIMYHLLMFVCT